MSERDIQLYLDDILDSGNAIMEYVKGMSFDSTLRKAGIGLKNRFFPCSPHMEEYMKKVVLAVIALMVLLFCGRSAMAVEVAPRITDREIIEGLTEIRGDIKRLEEGQKVSQKQIDDLRIQVGDTRRELKEFLLWGFGVTFAGIFTLIGFVLWDRRTALAPAVDKIKAVEEREEVLEKVLKEMARKDANAAEALRHAGLIG